MSGGNPFSPFCDTEIYTKKQIFCLSLPLALRLREREESSFATRNRKAKESSDKKPPRNGNPSCRSHGARKKWSWSTTDIFCGCTLGNALVGRRRENRKREVGKELSREKRSKREKSRLFGPSLGGGQGRETVATAGDVFWLLFFWAMAASSHFYFPLFFLPVTSSPPMAGGRGSLRFTK